MRKELVKIWVMIGGCILFWGMLSGTTAKAEVSFTGEAAGGENTVYVAGNPDWYPLEYYNEDSGCYEGMLPQILELIGERTGLSFTYIRAGRADQRMRLAENNQVELVSGCDREKTDFQKYGMTESRVVLSFSEEDRPVEVCFGFTGIAGPELAEAVNEALVKVSGQELAGIAVSSAGSQERQAYPAWLLAAALAVLLVFLAVIAVLVRKLLGYRQAAMRDRMFDPVLGIGNKEYFIWNFNRFVSEQYRAIYSVVYVGFDIERVNHYYGEAEAEAQLSFAARELQRSTGDTNIVARVSGGGFAVAHPCGGKKEQEKWVEELLRRLNQYCDKFGKDYRPEFYAGIYMLKQSDQDCETVLYNARQGYQHAVRHNQAFVFSHAGLLRNEDEKLQLKKRTREALKNHEFQMFLQFIVSGKNGRIVSAEALSRWDHPQKGLLHPGSYIELMETEKTVAELDFYIFEAACRQLELWAKEGRKTSISCNFTRITIDDDDFLARLQSIAKKYFFDYSSLTIEITEDVMEIHKEMAFANISRCKDMGFRIALDDAGSGYTSFADLRDYPIDVVKIDRSILCSAANAKGIALLRGMIALVHSLGMKILCEGVETREQWELLKRLDCDYMQGYYFYRALPVKEANRLLSGTGQAQKCQRFN